ncbi:Fe-S cluster assembly protein SufD [Buttiauxella sp. S04-F03]|uniref:Fe-S cluster assembly protein SufD n=1 Tax=Buttiauxella sp. W03-F01 TaxID=2904524 RepID=UPI001E560B24|nr:Fe-S cluster assembly protein SufD [Buttiauxella sp. W03-F01]MCE0799534.1 Fe-S cluster assembly protein SufD [Buttiauxella sp. W03-F01]
MAGLPNSSNSNALQQWHHLFETQGEKRSKEAQEHMQQMLRLGLPTRKNENWKYTPLEGLLNNQFVLPAPDELTEVQRDALALSVDAWRLVFVDGRFNAQLSDDLTHSGFDVTVDETRDFLPAAVQGEVFLHLTESLAETVTHIRVARNHSPAKALLLMHISRGSEQGEMNTAHYRHHLSLGEGAKAKVIEHYVSLDEHAHFTGARFTAEVGANSQLHHDKLAFENAQSYHFAHNDLIIGQDAAVESSSFLLGAAVLRHNTSTQLTGENTQLRMNSLALPINNEVCDTRTWLEHNKGYCNSRQLHKTIVRDKGRAVFNGMIKVAKHAIKTDGQMTNNNLLLGRLAEVDTKPQLEIYADDVKCSHGATIGRIDDEQMFYLRSRGIKELAALQMIIFAFAAELTESIRDEALKQQVLARIGQRFAGGDA